MDIQYKRHVFAHVHVGVVTRGQAAADEAAATPPPMQVQTERALTTNLATVIPSAPRMAISLPPMSYPS